MKYKLFSLLELNNVYLVGKLTKSQANNMR